ncbi:MAG: hypothetical protein RJA35_741, partial [Actinomycetota bacterium]
MTKEIAKGNRTEDWLQRTVQLPEAQMVALYGPEDRLLKALERVVPEVEVMARGNVVHLAGPSNSVRKAEDLVYQLMQLVESGSTLTEADIVRSLGMLDAPEPVKPAEVLSQSILSSRGKSIRPKTLGQKQYVDAIDENTIVFGIGPAGTGKTYLAMAKAVQALQR